MGRPKANTKEGKLASKRWRETMLKKYGKDGMHQKMVEMGRKGGQNSTTGGFASDKVGADGLTGWQRASLVGAIGGLKSSRKGVKNGEGKK